MKVVLIGDSSVGKSALVSRFTQNTLPPVSKATVGIAFCKQNVIDPDTNESYTVQIWDTAGQEKFQSVTTHHYRNADGALLVFDTTNEASFRGLDRWLNELYENTDPNVVVMLVGTKVDLAVQRVVTEERGRAYAQKNRLLYAETSSFWDKHYSTGRGAACGASPIFEKLVQKMVSQHKEMGHNPLRIDMAGFGGKRGPSFRLGGGDEDKQGACEC